MLPGATRSAAARASRRRYKRRRAACQPRARTPRGKQQMATAAGASLPLDASVQSIVANLEGLDLDGLRRQWRAHLGGEAPTHLSRWLLVESAGVPAPVRRIRRSRQIYPKRIRPLRDRGWCQRSFRPPCASDPEGLGLKVGALLVREWNGRLEQVMIFGRGLRLERSDLRQPVPDRQGDDGDQLERPPLLRAPAGKDPCGK